MTGPPPTTIRVGHSPDSDDAFMFYALTHDKLDTGGLRFVHQLEDIETLNKRALNGELEVSAVSIHAFAHLADRYALLASGSSMGDRYGPTLVTREPMTLDELRGQTIAVPGLLTTAYLTLQLCLGKDVPVVVMPFDQILPAVAEGRVRGRALDPRRPALLQGQRACTRWSTWAPGGTSRRAFRLPLGGNVVRKDLGPETGLADRAAAQGEHPLRAGQSPGGARLRTRLRARARPGPGGPVRRHVRQRVDRRLRPARPRGGSHASRPRQRSGFSPGPVSSRIYGLIIEHSRPGRPDQGRGSPSHAWRRLDWSDFAKDSTWPIPLMHLQRSRSTTKPFSYYRLDSLTSAGLDVARLPFSLKILLENLLRHEDGVTVTSDDIKALANWDAKASPTARSHFAPAGCCSRISPACPRSSTWPRCATR